MKMYHKTKCFRSISIEKFKYIKKRKEIKSNKVKSKIVNNKKYAHKKCLTSKDKTRTHKHKIRLVRVEFK